MQEITARDSACCLTDYCTSLYDDDETERCWLAYQYFEEKKVDMLVLPALLP